MPSSINLIFAFKEIFNDDDASRIISTLRNHPIVWNFLSTEGTFLRIVESIGKNPENWNIRNVISNAVLEEDELITSEKGNAIEDLESLKNIIQDVEKKRINNSWLEIIEFNKLGIKSSRELVNKWGTVFAYFYTDKNHQLDLERTLLGYSDSGQKIISFLMKAKGIQDQGDFILRNKELLINNPTIIKTIKQNLDEFGCEEEGRNLIRVYLPLFDLDGNISRNKLPPSSDNDDFQKMKNNLEISKLSDQIGDEDREKHYRNKANEIFKNISVNGNDTENIKDDEFSQVLRIYKSDPAVAKQLCKKLVQSISMGEKNIAEVVNRETRLSGIEKVEEVFLSLNLHHDFIFLLERINSECGNNNKIEKKIVNICAEQGDHNRVVRYYSLLFGESKLSREEKITLSKSYIYLENWDAAYLILKSLNSINIEDVLLRILCELKTNRVDDARKSSIQAIKRYPGIRAFSAVQFCFDNHKDAKYNSEFQEVNNENYEEINILTEILYHFMENIPSHTEEAWFTKISKLSIKGKLYYYEYFQSIGNSQEADRLLIEFSKESVTQDQKIFEKILDCLVERGFINESRNFLENHPYIWPLSKSRLKSECRIAIHDGNFQLATNLLSKILSHGLPDNETIELFGVSLIKSTMQDYPFSTVDSIIPNDKLSKFTSLINSIEKDNLSIGSRILQIELLSKTKTSNYLALGSSKINHKSEEEWRIPFAIGCHFYRDKQFDKAIFYLNESRKINRNSQLAVMLLIESYDRLRLQDEAINLIRKALANGNMSFKSLITVADNIYMSNTFMDFIDSQRKNSVKSIDFDLVKAKALLARGLVDEARSLLDQIERNDLDGYPNHLLIAQFLYLANDNKSTKRVLEKYLSSKPKLIDNEIIEAAGIYYKIGQFEKSLNLLSILDENKFNLNFIKAKIFSKIGELKNSRLFLIEGIKLTENKRLQQSFNTINIPEDWLQVDVGFFQNVLLDVIKEGKQEDIQTILGFLSNNGKYTDLALEAVLLIDSREIVGNYEKYLGYKKENNLKQIRIFEIINSLENGLDVLAADHYSKLVKENGEDYIVMLLGARLQIRSGDINNAGPIIHKIHSQLLNQSMSFDDRKQYDLCDLNLRLLLTESLYELGSYKLAFDLLKEVISFIGLTKRVSTLYIKLFNKIIEDNRLNNMLLVQNHNYRFEEVDLKVYEQLCGKKDSQNTKQFSNSTLNIPDADDEKDVDCFQKISTFLEAGEIEKAERILEKCQENDRNLFVYAVLVINHMPEKAIPVLSSLIGKDPGNPRYLFAMALAYEKEGRIAECYPAACLAIDAWPDEYEWENFAGIVSLRMGDKLSAMRHFKNAEKNNPSIKYTQQIINSSHNLDAIIESLNGEGSIPHRKIPDLIEFAFKAFEQNDLLMVKKIVKKIETVEPANLQTQLLRSRIAHKENKYKNALKIIEVVLEKHPLNTKAIIIKGQIIQDKQGIKKGMEYLNKMMVIEGVEKAELFFPWLKMLAENQGIDAAIDYLNNDEDLQSNHQPTDLADFLLEYGKYEEAQPYVERLLNDNANGFDTLMLAGRAAELKGDLDKALDFFQRGTAIDPFEIKGYIKSADVFNAKRQFDFACEMLFQGIELNPHSVELLKYTVKYLYKIGRFKRAQELLRRAYTINNSDREIEELNNLLNNALSVNNQES